MNSVLIKQVLLNNQLTDILIDNKLFKKIAPHIEEKGNTTIIDGTGKAILPPFYNGHTHAAMTLLRGYADDLQLFEWLNNYIWPLEGVMTAKDIYNGSRLAILEMIKSGTVFFNDMYWEQEQTIRAAEEMGIKAAIGFTTMNRIGEEGLKRTFEKFEYFAQPGALPDGISAAITPHAVYTVDKALMQRCVSVAEKYGTILHIHISETEEEVSDCLKEHGMTPVHWLNQLGALNDRTVAAHVVHVNKEEADLLAQKNVTIVHNPVSNMKLASGAFNAPMLLNAGCRIMLGTDGCSSNNNLDMREEMKFAALLAKCIYKDPALLPASDLYKESCKIASKTFHLNTGTIEEGKNADAILLQLNNERMMPCFNLISNFLYSADHDVIDTVLCDGQILMLNGKVKDEENIIEAAKESAFQLEKRYLRKRSSEIKE